MLIKKLKPKEVELLKLTSGDVFEYKDDIYMLLKREPEENPRVVKAVDLNDGRVFTFSCNGPVISLKAKLTVEFENCKED